MEALSLGGNWVDLVFLAVLVYFMSTNRGFAGTLVDVGSFLFALLVSYQSYGFIARFFVLNFSVSRGVANVLGFFITWFLAELLFAYLVFRFLNKPIKKLAHMPANKYLGFLAGALEAAAVYLFFVSLVFALPVRGQVKQDILNSRTGPLFVNAAQTFETRFKDIFGPAVTDSLNFLTIRPTSTETVNLDLGQREKVLTVDPQSETLMLNLVNEERSKAGLPPLVSDPAIQKVSRAYAREMFEHGFFSHVSEVDGSTPAERGERAGIAYEVYGENLAFAPDVYIAHQGLMNSEGHRQNILSEEYGRGGIGVIDGGVFGKMFVQNFAD